ncbi:MAG: GNAT family N-acetyltransferase [Gammaproteobacteria bacterium]
MGTAIKPSLTTAILSDASAFNALGEEWDSLLDRGRPYTYFLRPDWNRLWWKYCAPDGAHLYLITCRDPHGALVGLAPLYWRQFQFLGIPLRELQFLGMGIQLKSSEYMDLIARPGQEQAVAAAIADRLHRSDDWDRICLWQMLRDSVMFPHTASSLSTKSELHACDRAPYIDTSTSWQPYKASLGRSMRRNIEYYPRRLFKRYACEFGCVRDSSELDDALDALIHLHQARWQGQGEPGTFSDPAVAELLREAARHSLPRDRLRLWTLKINGTTEAALIGFLDNGALHYFQKGFNPAYTQEDIGTAMLALCIRDCFEDPAIRAFDFMGGGAAYKDRWAHTSREIISYQATRLNARTVTHSLQKASLSIAADAYHALVPHKLQVARANWLRQRRSVIARGLDDQ